MSKKYIVKTMPVEDLLKLSSNEIPLDKKLLDLMEKAHLGQLLCYKALIKIEGIKPFSDFEPVISQSFKDSFNYRLVSDFPNVLHVYQEGEEFIMSDDYNSYYSYLERGSKEIPCIVFGDPTGKYVINKGKPFKFNLTDEPLFIEDN